MDSARTIERNSFREVNLKEFLIRIFSYKWLFLASILLGLGLAYLYNKIATPRYAVGTSILIDASGSQNLGKSRFLEGGVSQIDADKNIFNEMGVLTSFSLVKQTLEELNFDITYKAGSWYKMEEYYGNFPFRVVLLDSMSQIHGVPFEVKLMPNEQYQLSIKSDKFYVSDGLTGDLFKVEKPLDFTKIYNIGEDVKHEYFNFALMLPEEEVDAAQFAGQDLTFELHHITDLTNAYLGKLNVSQPDVQASILKLKTEGPVVQKEIQFLENLISNYIFVNLEKRDEIASSKEAFIRDQLGDISVSLSRAESKMSRFRGSNNSTVNIDQKVSSNMSRLEDLDKELNQIELNIKYYKQLLGYIENSDNVSRIIAPSAVGIDDPLLNENILELKNLYSERTKNKFYKGEKSYDLEILDQQIDNTTAALRENVRNLIRSSELANKDRKGRKGSIERELRTLPRSQRQLGQQKRQSTLYEDLYNYLSQELAKTGIARAANITNARILDAPRMLGSGPIAPQKKLTYLLGLLLGLTLPFGWIVLKSSMDNTIYSASQLEKIAPLPVAASIAHLSTKTLFGKNKRTQWQVEESFRDLSANLQFLINDPDKKVIGITSTISNEGKTFCATNLALSLATSGKKVLLIDLDFRNPSVFREISATKEGLDQYLIGKVVLAEKIIHQYPSLETLDFIPTKHYDKNPHELLASSKLQILLGELRHHYDYIIVDSPAVGSVSDYLLVANQLDVHFFILRNQVSQIDFIDDLMKLKEKGEMENTFFILNDVNPKSYKKRFAYYGQQKGKVQNFVTRLFSF